MVKMMSQYSHRTEIEGNNDSPEEKLWRAVFATAVSDALHTPKVTRKGKYKRFTEMQDINEARSWFFNKEETFSTMCEALNLDEDMVHKKVTSKIKQKQFVERHCSQ
jgi:hypothetical protein